MHTPRSRRIRVLVRDTLFEPGATEAMRPLRPLFNLLTLLGVLRLVSIAAITWLLDWSLGGLWTLGWVVLIGVRGLIWIADIDDTPDHQ